MERHFDREFNSLKQQIFSVGNLVQAALNGAIKGLVERDASHFIQVHKIENQINQAHKDIDEFCIKLLAKQSPLAANLRLVFSVVKINADLERMGDQAVNIAYNAEHYIKVPSIKPLIDLPKMTDEVKWMISNSIEAFVKQDMELAQKVLEHDDVVDEFKDQIFVDLTELMKKDATAIQPALNLILIARNLERLGDHATNIAEEAIFDASGRDIRHGGNTPNNLA